MHMRIRLTLDASAKYSIIVGALCITLLEWSFGSTTSFGRSSLLPSSLIEPVDIDWRSLRDVQYMR